MDILLNSVVPAPLQNQFNEESLWGKEAIFQSGHYYLVKAHSGKGKSTLLSYVYGLRSDFSGTVIIGNQSVKDIKLNQWSDLRQKSLAIVFQDLRLFDDLTAWQNIVLKQRLTSFVSDAEIREMAETLGVTSLLGKKIKHLSMGQQQRIALIRALSQPFKWLLLDEPFSHLDEDNTNKMEQLIDAQCKKQSAGLILTSLGADSRLKMDKVIAV